MEVIRRTREKVGAYEVPVRRRRFSMKILKSGIPVSFYDPPRSRWGESATRIFLCHYLSRVFNPFDEDSGSCLIYWTIKPPHHPMFRLPIPEPLPIAKYHLDPFFRQKMHEKWTKAVEARKTWLLVCQAVGGEEWNEGGGKVRAGVDEVLQPQEAPCKKARACEKIHA